MGIHDHRFRLGQAVRQAYDRVAGGTVDQRARLKQPRRITGWPKIVIGLGAMATALWMLVLVWFVLRLLWWAMERLNT
jgi:hypothetical protein